MRDRLRPLIAGASVAHLHAGNGTLGYFVRSVREGDSPSDVFALSNRHVFVPEDHARAGDILCQPAPGKGGTVADQFANLTRWSSIAQDSSIPNYVDAAIGKLAPDIGYRREIPGIGGITGVSDPRVGMVVCKVGRATGYTEGRIVSVNEDVIVDFDERPPARFIRFVDQFRIVAVRPYLQFTLHGDSGSVVIEKQTRKAVGLFFAGAADGSYALANPMRAVEEELEIRIITS